MTTPDPSFPYPRVQHVVVIDLTGDYYDSRELFDSLRAQARYIPAGAHVRVKLDEQALRAGFFDLGRQIAYSFSHTASIDLEVPGGVRQFADIATAVDRHVRQIRADSAALTAQLAEPPRKTG